MIVFRDTVLITSNLGQVMLDLDNGVATDDEIAMWYREMYDAVGEVKVTQLPRRTIKINYRELRMLLVSQSQQESNSHDPDRI